MKRIQLSASALILGLLVTGCAGNQSSVAEADTAAIANHKRLTSVDEKDMKCTYTKRVGSHRKTRRCVDKDTYERERKEATDALLGLSARGSKVTPPPEPSPGGQN